MKTRRVNTRNLIVDTASRLFYDRGYNLTGINEIIAEAGIAKATLYSHFRSKDELAVAYLQKRDAQLMEGLRNFIAQKPEGNDQLLAIFDYLNRFFETEEFAGCWCIRTYVEVPVENELVRKQVKAQKDGLLDYFQELVAANRPYLNKVAGEKLARRIYLLYEAAVTESHLQQDDWPIRDSKELLQELLEA